MKNQLNLNNFANLRNREKSKAPKGADGELKRPEDELRNIQMLDGREERRIITINNHFPGPVIRVRKGAAVIVNVRNEMPIQAATVHWHGILVSPSPSLKISKRLR